MLFYNLICYHMIFYTTHLAGTRVLIGTSCHVSMAHAVIIIIIISFFLIFIILLLLLLIVIVLLLLLIIIIIIGLVRIQHSLPAGGRRSAGRHSTHINEI